MCPNGFLKMKVKLATHILSHSVAAALNMAVSGGLLSASAAGTAEMVSKFDEILDCLNSSTFNTPKELNGPMTASSKHVQVMEEMLEYVKKIKVVDPANHKDVTSTLNEMFECTSNSIKVPLQANFFIGDIKSRHDSYSICPKIFSI